LKFKWVNIQVAHLISLQLMSDEEAAKYVDGIAVHWYLDTLFPPSLLDRTHNNFPDKFILATEACVGKAQECFNPLV